MRRIIIALTLLFQFFICFGQIKTAKIFSDNMVLQREIKIPVWGKATPHEIITVRLNSAVVSATTSDSGSWIVYLPEFDAGGPFSLIVKGRTDSLVYKNVLIGDVWFASGQSNMEHPMAGWEFIPHSAVKNYKEEILDSDYPEIRFFTVLKFPAPVEQDDLIRGKWEIANSESVAGFSSTAWFFAKELSQKLKIPIGIINCSWGGTPISTWMARESLEHFKDSLNLPDIPDKFNQKEWTLKIMELLEKNWERRNQISYPVAGLPEEINRNDFDDSSWNTYTLLDSNKKFGNIVWLRKKLVISKSLTKQKLKLSLGFLNRQSQIFLNGTELGYFQYPKPIIVDIPRDLIHPGDNILTIRLTNFLRGAEVFGNGEQFFISDFDSLLFINIAENWKTNDQIEQIIPATENFSITPTYLFNGMVAPVIPYGIKGFIWYQGESDVKRPYLYAQMFQQMIIDWRSQWKQGNLPFLFVQLSYTYESHIINKKYDSWCLLREAQQKALLLPKTGMVVSIDIGDPFDIHPKNKQVIGHRLAIKALEIAYD